MTSGDLTPKPPCQASVKSQELTPCAVCHFNRLAGRLIAAIDLLKRPGLAAGGLLTSIHGLLG